MKTRVVPSRYVENYYDVQIKRWWWPWWYSYNTYSYNDKGVAIKVMTDLHNPPTIKNGMWHSRQNY